ncbi:MAG: hypothetical protein ACLTW9_27045 [Enterocloster sp.]
MRQEFVDFCRGGGFMAGTQKNQDDIYTADRIRLSDHFQEFSMDTGPLTCHHIEKPEYISFKQAHVTVFPGSSM